MPPKQTQQKGKAKPSKGSEGGQQPEEPKAILQAVLLADSFNKRFRPLTLEKPRCLLPLANVPLIEYTFEFLALAGVEEVFMFCCAHADQIEEYVKSTKWMTKSSPFRLRIFVTPTSMSIGDVMRDLDMKSMIETDFLLVSGDIVSNLPLEGVLDEHRQRRKKDKNAIMTMLLREADPNHRTRAGGENGVFVLDDSGTKCLHYEEIRGQKLQPGFVALEKELLKQNKDIQIRNDLIDCYVDIVSPDVPALFTENFDYQHIRRDFVHGILTDSELYGKTIHTHIMQSQFAARVRSLQTYDAISRDIANRWVYPLCPDSNLLSGHHYEYERVHIYKERGAILARGSSVKGACIIGSGTTVGDGTSIVDCVIGRDCNIGKNVVLKGAYIWDNVAIGDNCTIEHSIIASEAAIGDRCVVSAGSVISYNVSISAGTIIPLRARITNYARLDEDETPQRVKPQIELVGKSGEGYNYIDSDDEDEDEREDIEQSGFAYGIGSASSSNTSLVSMSDLDEVEEDPVQKHSRKHSTTTKARGRRGSMTSATSDENDEDSFYREAYSSLLSALENEHPVEVIYLELNGLRMTTDAPFAQVRRATAQAMMTRAEQHMTSKDNMTATQAIDHLVDHLKTVLERMIFELDDQVDMLQWFQKSASKREKGGILLQVAAFKCYNEDILSEEAIFKWYDAPTSEAEKVKTATADFVKWLREAEEESEEDDEEEEEEDDDDDE